MTCVFRHTCKTDGSRCDECALGSVPYNSTCESCVSLGRFDYCSTCFFIDKDDDMNAYGEEGFGVNHA